MELKDREEAILQDRKALTDSLKMQEARYDKMKSHAMSQLEMLARILVFSTNIFKYFLLVVPTVP